MQNFNNNQINLLKKIQRAIKLSIALTTNSTHCAVLKVHRGINQLAPTFIGTFDELWYQLKQYENVSGIYLVYSIHDPSQFYVRSSINLSKSISKDSNTVLSYPKHNKADKRLSKSGNQSHWGVIIIGLYPPIILILMELFFIHILSPTLNVGPNTRIRSLPTSESYVTLSIAIDLAKLLLVHFEKNNLYKRKTAFNRLITFMERALYAYQASGKCMPLVSQIVFVYSVTGELLMSFANFRDCARHFNYPKGKLHYLIVNDLILNDKYLLSFKPLSTLECDIIYKKYKSLNLPKDDMWQILKYITFK
jgi:hypothetical protein